MPRSARIVMTDHPHHVIQRGHNRQVIFADEVDYRFYLDNLKEWKEKLKCKLYAYCLMTNHVHLVIDPGGDEQNLGLLMKRVAGRQTRYVNKMEKRSGTLWEGRYKSSPISTNDYLLACCRYVELNPVRARMVVQPEDYRWSSCSAKVGLIEQGILDYDPLYLELSKNEKERQQKYCDYVHGMITEEETDQIRRAIHRGQLTGTGKFIKEVEEKHGKRVEFRGQGRPRKT